jgi:uncharacterized protein YfiM (DUF2279 family)
VPRKMPDALTWDYLVRPDPVAWLAACDWVEEHWPDGPKKEAFLARWRWLGAYFAAAVEQAERCRSRTAYFGQHVGVALASFDTFWTRHRESATVSATCGACRCEVYAPCPCPLTPGRRLHYGVVRLLTFLRGHRCVTVETTITALMLAVINSGTWGQPPADLEQVVAKWNPAQRQEAYHWAMCEHLSAGDNPVRRHPRPTFLPIHWR